MSSCASRGALHAAPTGIARSMSDASIEPRAQLASLLDLVSPHVGLIKAVSVRQKSADQPDLPLICDGLLSHFDFRKGESAERGTSGKGLTEVQAMLGAISEAVERYCASHAPGGAMRRARLGEVRGGDAGHPGRRGL